MCRLRGELDRLGIALAKDECAIVADVSALHYFSDDTAVSFDFMLKGKGVCADFGKMKLNHRYPNTWYRTLSSVHGRKLCRMGCLCVMKKQYAEAMDSLYLSVHEPFCEEDFSHGIPGNPEWDMHIMVPVRMPDFVDDICCTAFSVRFICDEVSSETGYFVSGQNICVSSMVPNYERDGGRSWHQEGLGIASFLMHYADMIMSFDGTVLHDGIEYMKETHGFDLPACTLDNAFVM